MLLISTVVEPLNDRHIRDKCSAREHFAPHTRVVHLVLHRGGDHLINLLKFSEFRYDFIIGNTPMSDVTSSKVIKLLAVVILDTACCRYCALVAARWLILAVR